MADPVFKVPSIDYTSRDFESLRDDMIALIPFFTPSWTDHNPSDLGIVLLEEQAYVADILHFYIDRMLGEAFIKTAVTQSAHDNINKMLNYTPSQASAATGNVAFTLVSAQSSNITIPARTKISTAGANSIGFETDLDAILLAGSHTVTVAATQGVTVGKVTDIANAELVGTSDGTPFQTFTLSQGPVIAGTVKPHADEGSSGSYFEYFEVDNFSDTEPDDRVFVRGLRPDGFTQITFPDGVNGRIPPALSQIRVPYRKGGGTAGNIGALTLTTITTTIPGAPPLTPSNVAAFSGGSDPETLSEQKENSPASLTAVAGAVTAKDYRTIAKTISAVYDAHVFFVVNSATAHVAVAPFGGVLPSTTLKTSVQVILEGKNCLGTSVIVDDPTIIPINIEGTVVLTAGASQALIKETVDAAVELFLSFGANGSNSKFNQSVYLSDIICVIDDIEGVGHVDLTKLTRTPVPILDNWRDSSGTISITVGGDNTTEQTLSVVMDDSAPGVMTYVVTGSVSGVLGAGTATVAPTTPTPLAISGAGVSFQMSIQFSSITAVGPSDTFTATIGKYLGNQTITNKEIANDGTIVLAYISGS